MILKARLANDEPISSDNILLQTEVEQIYLSAAIHHHIHSVAYAKFNESCLQCAM
jgi:hypothetical protein